MVVVLSVTGSQQYRYSIVHEKPCQNLLDVDLGGLRA